MTEIQFRNRKLNIEKLQPFGFVKSDDSYIYQTDLAGGEMKLTVKIAADEKIYAAVMDTVSGDEYVLHRVVGAAGVFVGQIRSEYEAVLEEISLKCFDPDVFKSEQAKAVISFVRNTYGDELEYLWQKFPDNAVVRRKDSKKWYAALLTVSRRRLGFDSDEKIEILDLRMAPEDIRNEVDNIRILPGYHMNKNHWITICLDEAVSTKEILERIRSSYMLAGK